MADTVRITQFKSSNGANKKQRDTLRTLRGPHMKKSMPFEQFGRTHTQPVNLRDLEQRFDDGAEVTPDALVGRGLATRKGVPVKILGQGEITKKLTVHAHGFSTSAR